MKHQIALLVLLAIAEHVMSQGSCDTPLQVSIGVYSVDTVYGEGNSYCGPFPSAVRANWYAYTATVDTTIVLSTSYSGPMDDTRVTVYSGTCGTLECIAWNDDANPSTFSGSSSVCWRVAAGTTYLIALDDFHYGGAFEFSLQMRNWPIIFNLLELPGLDSLSGVLGVVDMNDDGMDDLLSPYSSSVEIWHQGSDQTLTASSYPTPYADNAPQWSLAVGDWDGNSHRDMLYGGNAGATFMTANADGTGYSEWSPPNYILCQRTNFADINNDGLLDAFVSHDVDDNVAFLNNGQGQLVYSQGGYGTNCGNYGSIFTDVDNDGAVDLFVARCGCYPYDLLLTNNGAGGFTDVSDAQGFEVMHQSWSGAWGDFDNDGDMDGFIGSFDAEVGMMMENDGAGNFSNNIATSGLQNTTGMSPEWVAHDLNNDGWIDITGGGLYLNNGDGTFRVASGGASGAFGDVDNDGYLDAASSGRVRLNGGSGNNWIRFNLVGVTSNRDGIGARVRIGSALGNQIRDIRSGEGFKYASFIGAHFGLGQDAEVEYVQIYWPSGLVQTIFDPIVNMSHTIIEGITTDVSTTDMASIGVYPNPVLDHVYLHGLESNAMVNVITTSGRTVLTRRVLNNRLDLSALVPGAYELQVIDSGKVRRARLVKL